MNYTNYSDEQLIQALMTNPNDSAVLEELVRRFRPTILGEALKYRTRLPYDTDDYLQEGRIVLWQIAEKKNYKTGNFKNYFISAIRFRYCKLYRDYVLHNFICIGGYEDIRGNTYQILVEAEEAEEYRQKHREHSRRVAEKKRAAANVDRPATTPKPLLTPEEKVAKRRARSLAYYYTHAEEMNQRAKDKRKAKREAKEAAKALEQRIRETERAALRALSFQPC